MVDCIYTITFQLRGKKSGGVIMDICSAFINTNSLK